MLNGTLGLRSTTLMALQWFRNPWIIVPIAFSGNRKYRATIQLRSGPRLFLRGSRDLSVPDISILHEVLVENCYFIDRLVQPGFTVLDIGAHIGCFSVLAARRVGPTGKVVGFEPETDNFDVLQSNIRINPDCRLDAYKIAVTGSPIPRSLCRDAKNSGGHTLLSQGDSQQIVDCCTLEEAIGFTKSKRIDLLKMDCEGSEFEIIDTASIESLCRIDRIIMEVHDTPYTPSGAIAKLHARLQEAGFTITTKHKEAYFDGHFSLVLAERRI